MKDINEMSELELLQELVADKRKNDRIRTISYAVIAGLLFVIGAAVIYYLPKIDKLITDYNTMINEINEISKTVKSLTEAINIDPELIKNLSESIRQVMDMFKIFN